MSSYVWTVVGSGFGLYGYLPGIFGGPKALVVLPERVKARLVGRSELRIYDDLISWRSDELCFSSADSVVLAVPPKQQEVLIDSLLSHQNIVRVVLEKPIAATPAVGRTIGKKLRNAAIEYRINYSFWFTNWATKLLELDMNGVDAIAVDWRFMAHHFNHNTETWKRYHSQGGGALRFYGIHVIALLSRFGYSLVKSSTVFGESSDVFQRWECILGGSSLPECKVVVDSKASSKCFSILAFGKGDVNEVVYVEQPFALEKTSEQDQRTSITAEVVRQSLVRGDESLYNEYDRVIQLWASIEDKTSTVIESYKTQEMIRTL